MLGACADMQKKAEPAPPPPSLESMLSQASAANTAGQSDKALGFLKTAASTYPADKEPWLQMAQMDFDHTNYGGAINNALEALQRDPENKLGNSIVAVAGLRLSTKALADLSQRSNLTGSVRTEAQDLAKLLRESLGETVLVPVQPKQTVQAKPVRHPGKPPVNGAAAGGATAANAGGVSTTASAAPAASAPSATQKGDNNPFGSLK
jgi:hypothetical protein